MFDCRQTLFAFALVTPKGQARGMQEARWPMPRRGRLACVFWEGCANNVARSKPEGCRIRSRVCDTQGEMPRSISRSCMTSTMCGVSFVDIFTMRPRLLSGCFRRRRGGGGQSADRPSRGEVDRVDVVVFLGPARDTAPGPGQLDAGPHFNYVKLAKLSHLSRLLAGLRAAGAKRGKLDGERGKPPENKVLANWTALRALGPLALSAASRVCEIRAGCRA